MTALTLMKSNYDSLQQALIRAKRRGNDTTWIKYQMSILERRMKEEAK